MRGTPDAGPVDAGERGIIPAYAGNTFDVASSRCAVRDHPRVCGEHLDVNLDNISVPGSSPRMRGTHLDGTINPPNLRIIPAYAGNTFASCLVIGVIWDHPRVCGEHPHALGQVGVLQGSSPRMRGTRQDRPQVGPSAGIIPAYAGNTFDAWGIAICPRDHPRVCGEHGVSLLRTPIFCGSSPRMRGTLNRSAVSEVHHGIIPAYAGNTSYPISSVCNTRDHPRVCGEHTKRL